MSRLLLDLNVVLDVLLDRHPHAGPAAALWAAVERGRAQAFLPAHGFTTIHYLARRARGAKFARDTIAGLLHVFSVAQVDAAVIHHAIGLAWADFEDAVCTAAAVETRCDAIVSRDPSGFPDSPVPVVAPEAALTTLRPE